MQSRDDLIEQLVAITGTNRDEADRLLEMSNDDVSRAVDLLYAPTTGPPPLTDEELAQQLSRENGSTHRFTDEVRAPIPAKRDRLYGEDWLHHHRSSLHPPTTEISAFRDFEAERTRKQQKQAEQSVPTLGQMFEPPHALIFKGNFEEAKVAAQNKSLWLLVNIQSNVEFASHLLNRDTWADPTLQDIIKGSFIFLQFYDSAPEGQKVQGYYKLHELPAIVVIDPITGSLMRTLTGSQTPERLVEELMPFLECNPDDPAAHRKTQNQRQRRGPSVSHQPTEAEELQMAMALSMDQQSGRSNAEASASQPPAAPAAPPAASMPDAGPPIAQPAPERLSEAEASTVQKEAAARLPPADGLAAAESCGVAVRLPDGSRVQRRFPRSAAVAAISDLCLASSVEAAGGKRFVLREARPGAPALIDPSATLEAAGLVNSLVAMSWE